MLIDTAVFGPVEVADQDVIQVPDGLLGFDGIDRYTLIVRQEDDVVLRWLQAVEQTVPCFVVFDPFEIIEDYSPDLEPGDYKALGCDRPEDLSFFVIAVVPENVSQTTVNLKSPIVINRRQNLGRQVILRNRNYPIRFPLCEQVETSAE